MKIPTELLGALLLNAGELTGVAVERDLKEISSRLKHEGVSFLTITMPSLCEALDRGLATGRITRSMFMGFRPCSRRGSLPAFLSGFFIRVFRRDGELLPTPCIDSIEAIRQVTRFCKKVELPCTSARQKRAFERYIDNDSFVSFDSQEHYAIVRTVSGILWTSLQQTAGTLFGFPACFGGGATGERLSPNGRWTLSQWPERGEFLFPISVHGTHDEGQRWDDDDVAFLTESDEQPVRVVMVPKTLKTPRIISVEPSYMMLRQQSLAKPLMVVLESMIPNNVIRFEDQTPNQELARVGSVDGSLATIDLSDASDRVSNDLVKMIFGCCPAFLELLQGARSTRAVLPDGTIRKLNRFASQGSACCFPVEAMVFYTLICSALVHQSGKRPSSKLIAELTAMCSVYGDDIVVPSEAAPVVMEFLEAFGLKVNHDKSYHIGHFRESCGGDFYKGTKVTPVYLRRFDRTGTLKDPDDFVSWVSLANQFYLKGWWSMAQTIRTYVEERRGILPRSTQEIGCLTWTSYFYNTRLHWDRRLHGWMVKSHTVVAKTMSDPVGSIRAAMLKSFQPRYVAERLRELAGGPSKDGLLHLFPQSGSLDTHKSVRPYALNTKRRWTPTPVGIAFS